MQSWAKVAALVAACGLAPSTVTRGEQPLGVRVEPLGEAHIGSGVAVARIGGHEVAFVADEDDAVVHIVETIGLREIATVPVSGRPGQLLVLPDGRLLVAIRGGAEVAVFRIRAPDVAKAEAPLATPPEPIGLATTPDSKELLVASGWGSSLTAIDLATGRESLRVALPRDPRAVLTSLDGSKAFVSHAVGPSLSVVDLRDPGHSVIESSVDGWSTEERAIFEEVGPQMTEMNASLGPRRGISKRMLLDEPAVAMRTQEVIHPRKACQGFALARIESPSERVLAPEVEVETGDANVRSSGYGNGASMATEVPNVAVVPVATGIALPASMEVFPTVQTFAEEAGPGVVGVEQAGRENDRRPCVLPRAATAGRGQLYVACLGIDAVVEYEADVVAPQRVERRRWPVPSGPQGLALVASHLFVWSQFARELTVIDLDAEPPNSKHGEDAGPVEVALSRQATPAWSRDVTLGRQLFHASDDRRISGDGRACASCHPDGRDDSLTWSTPGGPRQTPMLAGRLEDTAPYGWDGAGKDVSMHLTHTFQRLSGRGLTPHEAASLIAYVKSLPVPPRGQTAPPRHEGEESRRVARGREIFHSPEAQCASCHQDDGASTPRPGTDGMLHDVESKLEADTSSDFDTPSLRFVAGTAPSFHDGRYATLRDVLTHTDGTMAKTAQLSGDDLDALESYVETL